MALDLQTKLQQAKLKIFGLNDAPPPTTAAISSSNNKKASHLMLDADFYDVMSTNDLNETDLFGKDKLISYENMFKQNQNMRNYNRPTMRVIESINESNPPLERRKKPEIPLLHKYF